MPGALSLPVLSLLELCFCGLVGRPRPLTPGVSAAQHEASTLLISGWRRLRNSPYPEH